MDVKKAIEKVIQKKDLSVSETSSVFRSIMGGKATSAQIGALLTALKIKGETIEEITGAARVMRAKAVRIDTGKGNVLDTCGTGGSGKNIFNVSTAVAFVVSACGVKVAKHGNRAASSKCGSADVLEALGVRIDITPKAVEKCIKEVGIGFLFAPLYHGAMKYAAGPRKEIGIRTIFNILGPLSNPAGADRQLLGVFDPALTEPMASVLKKLGAKHAFIVSGEEGLDEVSIAGYTRVAELRKGKIKTYRVKPSDFGIKKTSLSKIKGSSCARNAGILIDVFSGKTGPYRDMVLMNSSVALMAAGKVSSFKEGVKIASLVLDKGEVMGLLKKFIRETGGKFKGSKKRG